MVSASMNGNVERRIITEEDVRRVNDRRLGKLPPLTLSPEDEALFRRIKRVAVPLRKIRASVFSIRKSLKVLFRQREGLDNRMKKRLITVEDVQRANDRLMGKACKIVLSAEDAALFERIRRTLPIIKDGPELRQSWKRAQATNIKEI